MAIKACDRALEITPTYDLAKNNRKLAVERLKTKRN